MRTNSNFKYTSADAACILRRAVCFALLGVLMCLALSACGKTENPEPTTSKATQSVPSSAVASSVKPSTIASTSASAMTVNCDKSYKAVSATDLNHNKVELSDVFGSGYTQYGGELAFGSDGKFTVWIGVNKGGGSNSGTYSVSTDNSVVMTFGNKQIKTATVTDTDGTEITAAELEYGGYLVTFTL